MNKIGPKPFLSILGLFVASRVIIVFGFFIALHRYACYSVKGENFQYFGNKLLNSFGCWDSGWYINVAVNGYIKDPAAWGQSNYGFFPFYPMAMKAVALLVHDPFIAGIIVSNVLLLVGSFYLYLLCVKLYNNKLTAILAVATLYFFPGSYLLSGVFSESSFICFSIMCIYFFEKENYVLSGISGFLLTLTRPFGLLILLPLGLAYVVKHGLNFNAKSFYLILIPAGMLTFFAYCYFTTGDFLFYVHAKQIGWHTEYAKPWKVIETGLKATDNIYVKANTYYTIFWLGAVVLLIRFIPFYLVVWILLLILAPLSNGQVNLICMPRYILVCFPLFMMVAAFATRYKWAGGMLVLAVAIANIMLSVFFALGYQFAA